jgi:1,4-alpha-glucan branching enzyme
MPYRGGPRGEPSGALPPTAFVAFAQNHDQVGNRAFGDRLSAIASPEAVRAVGALYRPLPQIPMLFMREEWGAAQPFPSFAISDRTWHKRFARTGARSSRVFRSSRTWQPPNGFLIPQSMRHLPQPRSIGGDPPRVAP